MRSCIFIFIFNFFVNSHSLSVPEIIPGVYILILEFVAVVRRSGSHSTPYPLHSKMLYYRGILISISAMIAITTSALCSRISKLS